MSKDIVTINDMVQSVFERFQQSDIFLGHGQDDVWDEAVFLVLHCMGLPLDSDRSVLNQPVSVQQQQCIHTLARRRIDERVPLAYLIKQAWFAGLEFDVDERVLIPRSPLGELIEQQCSPWVDADKVHHALDLCTGSGCIGIAMAHYLPNAQVDIADICPDALAVAQQNIAKHHLQSRVILIQSDLFASIPKRQYDLIVSNPPYVDAEDMASMPAEYHHEPQKGLAAGEDGLDIVRKILQQAPDYLTEAGILIVEVGNSQQALEKAYPHLPFIWLEFARGGEGVFLISCQELKQ